MSVQVRDFARYKDGANRRFDANFFTNIDRPGRGEKRKTGGYDAPGVSRGADGGASSNVT